MCKVQVEFTDFPGLLGVFNNHTLITTTDANGSTFFRGGPRESSSGAATAGTSPGDTTKAGPNDILVESGPNNSEKNPDWQSDPSKNPSPLVLVDDDKPCKGYNDSFEGTKNAINAAHIQYRARSTNSNAVTTQLLRGAGIAFPGTPPASAPGWGVPLLR